MLAIIVAASGALNMPCADIKNIALERGIITSAVDVAAGLFKPANANANAGPPPQPGAPPPQPIPQHCRVTMVLTPTPDSNINVELWLPTENWNGKFLAVGNGGWAGAIQGYGDMQEALRRGYATAGTDTGHSAADGPVGMFALGHPEKIVDFAYRALHDMTVKSKRLIDVFYTEPLDYSYYKGCSTGGRQGVMAAQRYPGDYDGIIAGALANRHVHMHTAGAYRSIHLARHPDEALSEAKATLVNEAMMKQCDTLGEGFLNNPRECSFDAKTLACKAGEAGDSCLTPGELKTVETHYGGLRNSKGELIFSGQALGNPIPIIAGALANRHVHMHTAGAYRSIHLARHPDEALSEAKATLVNEAMMKQCDTLGEGFLNNPRECSFEAKTLACKAGEAGDSCLTPGELKTVETHYGGLRNSKGELIFSGQALGNPIPALAGATAMPGAGAFDSIRILGFQNADYDWRQFDLDRDMPIIDAAAGFVDATNPDLRAFEAHGGKLLLYAGWRDTGITPENTVYYYESVREEMGADQEDWMRLFLVPGMGHCRGGPGVDTFDTLATLEQWRERDLAPSEMLGTNRQTGMARPICAYPSSAKYDGSGDLKDAANWACTAPE